MAVSNCLAVGVSINLDGIKNCSGLSSSWNHAREQTSTGDSKPNICAGGWDGEASMRCNLQLKTKLKLQFAKCFTHRGNLAEGVSFINHLNTLIFELPGKNNFLPPSAWHLQGIRTADSRKSKINHQPEII
jgi:hypothetical protein